MAHRNFRIKVKFIEILRGFSLRIAKLLTAPFNNNWTLKCKIQSSSCFFAAVAHNYGHIQQILETEADRHEPVKSELQCSKVVWLIPDWPQENIIKRRRVLCSWKAQQPRKQENKYNWWKTCLDILFGNFEMPFRTCYLCWEFCSFVIDLTSPTSVYNVSSSLHLLGIKVPFYNNQKQ